MENRNEALVEIALLVALLFALLFGMYKYSSHVDGQVDKYFHELRERRAAERPLIKIGMTEQEELEFLLMPLFDEPANYVDREVQDWVDDHPFYEWGELV